MNCIASKLEKAPIYLSQNKQKNVFILPHKRKRYRFFCLASFALILVLIGVIPLRLAIAKVRAPQPQAILMLGGSTDREYFTAQFARKHSSWDIWISSGMPPKNARELFRRIAGISESQLHVDCRAVDTVTNFTSLVSDFKNRNIEHLYLITSDYHMPRAQAIATFVLGSQGIAFTSIPVPSKEPSESLLPTIRDVCRALLWIMTKRTGASFNNRLIPCERYLLMQYISEAR